MIAGSLLAATSGFAGCMAPRVMRDATGAVDAVGDGSATGVIGKAAGGFSTAILSMAWPAGLSLNGVTCVKWTANANGARGESGGGVGTTTIDEAEGDDSAGNAVERTAGPPTATTCDGWGVSTVALKRGATDAAGSRSIGMVNGGFGSIGGTCTGVNRLPIESFFSSLTGRVSIGVLPIASLSPLKSTSRVRNACRRAVVGWDCAVATEVTCPVARGRRELFGRVPAVVTFTVTNYAPGAPNGIRFTSCTYVREQRC